MVKVFKAGTPVGQGGGEGQKRHESSSLADIMEIYFSQGQYADDIQL